MSPFEYGYWEVAIEKHGRIKLPTALLKALDEDDRKNFVVTPGFGKHVMLWTMKSYKAQMDYLNSLDRNIIAIKKYRNAFRHGRILLVSRFSVPRSAHHWPPPSWARCSR